MKAKTIEEVIFFLEEIITDAKKKNSRTGYFPALYRKVTLRVKKGIQNGEFQNGEQMETLDVNFANRYLDAYSLYRNNGKPTLSWKLAFESCKNWQPVVLQHLLLGMNAHISLDLGIAAAETMKGKKLDNIKNDFNKINDLLISMIDEVQQDLAQVWPALKYLDKMTGNIDEKLSGFGMKIARGTAWQVAEEVWNSPFEKWDEQIGKIDKKVEKYSLTLNNPPWRIMLVLMWIRIRERQSVREVIDMLYQ